MEDGLTSKPPVRRQAIKLGPLSRWILGVVGVLGLAAGATAVFIVPCIICRRQRAEPDSAHDHHELTIIIKGETS